MRGLIVSMENDMRTVIDNIKYYKYYHTIEPILLNTQSNKKKNNKITYIICEQLQSNKHLKNINYFLGLYKDISRHIRSYLVVYIRRWEFICFIFFHSTSYSWISGLQIYTLRTVVYSSFSLFYSFHFRFSLFLYNFGISCVNIL